MNSRRKLWLAVLVFSMVVGMTACGDGGEAPSESPASSESSQPVSQLPEEPESSSSEPEEESWPGGPAQLLSLNIAPPELTATRAYQQALERADVITVNIDGALDSQVLTTSDRLRAFMANLEAGGEDSLTVYQLLGEMVYIERFHGVKDDMKRDVQVYYNYELDEEGAYEYNSTCEGELVLNEYGFLCYRLQDNSEPLGDRLVSGYELDEDYGEKARLADKYLYRMAYSASSTSWTSGVEALETNRFIWIFEDMYNHEPGQSSQDLWAEYGPDWPRSLINETLARYFDGFDPNTVLYHSDYNSATDTYYYEGGRGGGPVCYRVTAYSREGDLLTIEYENYGYNTGEPQSSGVMVVREEEDGEFKYISNQRYDLDGAPY